MCNERTADCHSATGLLVPGSEWYSFEQLLLSLLTFFGFELLHALFERGAIVGSNESTFSPGNVGRVLFMPPRTGQLVGLKASGLDILAVPFASVTMPSRLVMCVCLERTDPSFDGGIVLRRIGWRQEVEDVIATGRVGRADGFEFARGTRT